MIAAAERLSEYPAVPHFRLCVALVDSGWLCRCVKSSLASWRWSFLSASADIAAATRTRSVGDPAYSESNVMEVRLS